MLSGVCWFIVAGAVKVLPTIFFFYSAVCFRKVYSAGYTWLGSWGRTVVHPTYILALGFF